MDSQEKVRDDLRLILTQIIVRQQKVELQLIKLALLKSLLLWFERSLEQTTGYNGFCKAKWPISVLWQERPDLTSAISAELFLWPSHQILPKRFSMGSKALNSRWKSMRTAFPLTGANKELRPPHVYEQQIAIATLASLKLISRY